MSIYAVNLACRQLIRDKAYRSAMVADPRQALAGFDLTDDERRAIVEGDVGHLYRAGAHDFLLGYLMRFGVGGLTLPTYNARMRAVAGEGETPGVAAGDA